MHPDETQIERLFLRKSIREAQRQQDAATTDVEREDHGRRLVTLMQKFRLAGGDLHTLEGHEQRRWTHPWKGQNKRGVK